MSNPCIHYNLGVKVIQFCINKPHHVLSMPKPPKNQCTVRAAYAFPTLMFNTIGILPQEISVKKKISRSPGGLIVKR